MTDIRETPFHPPILGADIVLIEFIEDGPMPKGARAALDRFMALPESARAEILPHAYAYYRDYHAQVGGEDWLDEQMGVPEGPGGIWAHVHPRSIALHERHGRWYVSMEANCDWEEEHGFNAVWEDGVRLVKVGSYDGHVTNEGAFADDRLGDVIYAASDPNWTTRRSP